MKSELNYVTYQTFPARTANSLQTITNIKYFVKNGVNVKLYFPLREDRSSDNLSKIQNFYQIDESFEIYGLKHKLPHGKVKIFKKYAFQFSHYMWAKKTIKDYFDNENENCIFTRSDWIAYFAAKKGNKVIFECHQRSRTRDFVISRISKLQNVTIIFLNENLKDSYSDINKSIVLHNGVDHELFGTQNLDKRKSIVFVGNISRFNLSRGLPEFIKTYNEEKLYENYNLEIVGGNLEEVKKLENLVKNLNIANYVTFHGYLQRKSAIDIISECSIGLLINSSENQHSTEYTSPLKYFEYLYGGLNVIASDFPSHRTLPYNKMISFFNLEDKNSLTNALQNLPNINSDKNYLTEITVDKRVKKIIELIN
tara:strand:+ start:25 stop:1128 length:1104 start_codon:yes stop_codon:yes gene_type:complete